MPVPKERLSRSRTGSRRANHDKIEKANLSTCTKCGAYKLPHHVCGACGFYKNRQVIEMKAAE